MPGRSQTAKRIDDLMERASAALARTDYFECESVATAALDMALSVHDFDRMARLLLPLQEARRQRRLQAVDAGVVITLDEPIPVDQLELEPGCWLVCPPLVGADARELRDRLLAERIPAIVLAREPRTTLGRWPVVSVGRMVLRTRMAPPEELDPAWFLDAIDALGEETLASINPSHPPENRVEHLLARLVSLPESERLHQALTLACEEALRDTRTVAVERNGESHA